MALNGPAEVVGRRPVVFAPCSYTGTNKGDAALFHAMAAILGEELGPYRMVSTSFTPAEDAARYGVEMLRMPLAPDGRLAGRLHRMARGRRWIGRVVPYVVATQVVAYLGAMQLWARLWQVAPGLARPMLPAATGDLVDAIAAADVVAAVPGGYLMAPTVGHYHWLYHVATLGLCSIMGKRIVILPGSYGPFAGIHSGLARTLFTRFEVVMAREQVSAAEVAALGVALRDIVLAADTAFLLGNGAGVDEVEAHGLDRALPTSRLLGVSVMRHDYPGSPDPDREFEAYVDAVASALDWCVEHLGARPLFVTQVVGDGDASAAVLARMAHASDALSVDADLTPFGLKALYGRCELVVGSRIHANVLALAAQVPAVAIAYEHKCGGIMDLAGLGEYVVPITDAYRLQPVLARAWAARAANRDALARSLPAFQASARGAVQRVAAICREAVDEGLPVLPAVAERCPG